MPLKQLLVVTVFVLSVFLVFCCWLMIVLKSEYDCVLTACDFRKGHGDVNILLLHDRCLIAVDWWLKRVDKWLISVRRRLINSDHCERLKRC